MTSSWRAMELPLPDGRIAVDVTGSGKLTKHFVSYELQGISREIASPGDLANILMSSHTNGGRMAELDPVGFAYLVCILTNRFHHIFIRESMWPELEEQFALDRSENEPRVDNGKFHFTAFSSYMPVLKISRLVVDLTTLAIIEQPLIEAPWPPAMVTAV